jgi:hypothetical protein
VIVEPVICVILRCSRCNSPWLGLEDETPAHWKDVAQIAEAFKRANGCDVGGWRRTPNERYLCEDCHIVDAGQVVEKPPLRPVEQATVLRAHTEYARRVGDMCAFELTPVSAWEAPR